LIKVTGLKEIQQQLINLGSIAGTKAMRGAMRAATKPLLQKAKATAPSRSGALREALAQTFSVSAFGSGSRFSILVGPKVKNRTAVALYNLIYRTKRRGIYHGHFLEFGTATGTKATGFLRNALESTAQQCVSLLGSEIKKRIDKALISKRPAND
jgi:HK97 gp10 family phage protein